MEEADRCMQGHTILSIYDGSWWRLWLHRMARCQNPTLVVETYAGVPQEFGSGGWAISAVGVSQLWGSEPRLLPSYVGPTEVFYESLGRTLGRSPPRIILGSWDRRKEPDGKYFASG